MTSSQPRRWYEAFSLGNDRLFAVAVILAIAPLWFGHYLPLVDMPQHAGQIAALQQIFAGNGSFASAFQINWFTPYLLGYLLLYVVSLVLPITIATQVIVSLAVASVPMLTGRLLRAAGADERWKWLAIPAGYSFAFYWGFLSFIVAVPFALLFLIHTIRYVRTPTLKYGMGIAVFSIFLFFCHIIILGFTSLVALGYVVGSNYRNWKTLALRVLPYTAALPLIVVWLVLSYNREASVRTDPVVFGRVIDHLQALFVQPSGREVFSLFITVPVTTMVVLLPWLAGGRPSRRPERWLPFALGLLAFLTIPHYVLSTAYVYQRLGVFLVPLWLMVWERSDRPWRLDWIPPLVIVLWSFTNVERFAAFARETQSFDAVMAAMEPGRRTASMVFDNSSPDFALPVYLHFPVWYQARQQGFVDFNFADFLPQMVRYRPDAGPRMTDLLGWYPTEFQWEANGGANYDYFIVKARFDVSNEIFKEKRTAVELVARSGWWWLYRNNERMPAQ